jgi:hypothetical protein
MYLFTPDQQRLYSRLGWSKLESTTWHGISSDIMVKARVQRAQGTGVDILANEIGSGTFR